LVGLEKEVEVTGLGSLDQTELGSDQIAGARDERVVVAAEAIRRSPADVGKRSASSPSGDRPGTGVQRRGTSSSRSRV
jgi:hypothetical protein